jgi:protoporphyrin/coproporphyrin ferrochelatase
MKTGVLLINLGTPDSPSVKDVRIYLSQFLNDPFVIDINPAWRFFLVNFIIVPFRAPRSAELYRKIWTKEGSPLLIHTKNLTQKLQKSLGENFIVEFGMRYRHPSIENAFKKLKKAGVNKIIPVPLYPQYADSSTGSTIAELMRVIKKENFTSVKIIEHFYQDENFLDAWAEIAGKYMRENETDFFIFSYHGVPERQITKIYPDHCRINSTCCASISEKNHLCYRAACLETTRQLVKRLNIPEGKYVTSFQSRLNDKWLKPFSDKVVEEKARQGIKKMLVLSPAFVADCLETIYEIGVEYNEIFQHNGGEKLRLVESLNDNDLWVEALKKIILKNALG